MRCRRKTTRVCTWTYMYPVRPSRQPRQRASWPSGQNEPAGTAIPHPDFIVLADPDGNRFCIVDLSHAPD